MGKLHEVLAVESGLKATSAKVINEAKKTFTDKRGHFLGQYRHYEKLVEGTLEYAPEEKQMDSTVIDKLDYVKEHVIRAINAIYQKEVANTEAKADLVIDGKTLLEGVPATFLLTMESQLSELRSLYSIIPTVEPSRNWNKDTANDNTYVSTEIETFKTEKVIEPLVLYQATDKFPAQTEKISRDKVVGKWVTKYWSGCLTPSEKSKLLGRIDALLREVKKARMRANEQEVKTEEIAAKFFDYIHG